MTENNNRAVITGLGMICAIGNSVDEAWNNAINSVSGIHKTTTLDTTDCYADLAAEVKCDTLGDFEGSEDADRSAQLCIKAAGEAMKDAGLDESAQKIVFTKEVLSRNQGRPCYILEFYTDRCAYSYKVDAVTGEIIEKETEWLSRLESETVPGTSQNSDTKQHRGS